MANQAVRPLDAPEGDGSDRSLALGERVEPVIDRLDSPDDRLAAVEERLDADGPPAPTEGVSTTRPSLTRSSGPA